MKLLVILFTIFLLIGGAFGASQKPGWADINTSGNIIGNLSADAVYSGGELQRNQTQYHAYTIVKSGSTYFGYNRAGQIVSSGTNCSVVAQYGLTTYKNIFFVNDIYLCAGELKIPSTGSIEGEDRDNTKLEWVGVFGGKMISTTTWPVKVSNIYLDCDDTAGYGIYLYGFGSRPILDTITVVDSTISGVYCYYQDRSFMENVLSLPSTGKAFDISLSSYPMLVMCSGGETTDISLYISYSLLPVVFGGGYAGQIQFYRNAGGMLDGVDIEVSNASQKDVAFLAGGEISYAPISIENTMIANYKSTACSGAIAYSGQNLYVKGTKFWGDHMTVDIDGSSGSNVFAEGNLFKSGVFTGNVHLRGNQNFTTESSGAATVLTGLTYFSIWVPHGLAVTPDINDIDVTPVEDPVKRYWKENVTATGFNITMDSDPGAAITFGWSIN
jgi:hypothetical protein